MKECRAVGEKGDVTTLPPKKRGRRVLLGEKLDMKVQMYLREGGGVVSARIAVACPSNTTDRIQPMDLTVNKPAKDFLKRCFGDWYAEQIQTQLEENDIE